MAPVFRGSGRSKKASPNKNRIPRFDEGGQQWDFKFSDLQGRGRVRLHFDDGEQGGTDRTEEAATARDVGGEDSSSLQPAKPNERNPSSTEVGDLSGVEEDNALDVEEDAALDVEEDNDHESLANKESETPESSCIVL